MDDNPVPDLFCPEILADLEEIEDYYLEHLKHQTPCDTLLNHITADDPQDEPKCEPSLCETWDESWWNNSEPYGLPTADEDSRSPTSEEDTAGSDSLFNDSTGSLEPPDETASQLLNKIDNCLGCCYESALVSSPEVPTVYTSDSQVAILNIETNELLSVVPTLIADSLVSAPILTDESSEVSVSLSQQQQHAESLNSDGHADQTEEDAESIFEGLVPDSTDDSGLVSNARNETQAADDHIADDMVPSAYPQPVAAPIRAASSQVVPNLQMLLLAHREAGDDEDNDDNEQATYLQFHTPNSQSGDAYDSQVVPLWDQEE